MLEAIPESHRDLAGDDGRASVIPATTTADGTSQVRPRWFDAEDHVTSIRSTRGRTNGRNLAALARADLAITDTASACRCARIRGMVIEKREQGAKDLLGPTGQVRAAFMPRPDHREVKPWA